jgi:hypothetical protein
MRAGRGDAAREIFTALRDDPSAPNGVRSRAQELLASLGGPLETAQQVAPQDGAAE